MLGALGYVVLGFVANAHHRGVCPAEPLRAAVRPVVAPVCMAAPQNQQQAAASITLAALLATAETFDAIQQVDPASATTPNHPANQQTTHHVIPRPSQDVDSLDEPARPLWPEADGKELARYNAFKKALDTSEEMRLAFSVKTRHATGDRTRQLHSR